MPDAPGTGWAAGWAAAYLGIIIPTMVVVGCRRGATLCRGRSLLRFNVLFVVLAVGATLIATGTVPRLLLFESLVLLLASWLLRRRWLVVRDGGASVARVVEICLRRLCTPFERVADGYAVAVPGGALRSPIHGLGSFSTIISFPA